MVATHKKPDLTDLQRRWQFSVRSLLAFIVIAAVIAALAYYTLQSRAVAQRRDTTNDFRLIGAALHSFNAQYGRLPYPTRHDRGQAGNGPLRLDASPQPLYSWRFRIAPFIESTKLNVAFDKPWDDPANRAWHNVFRRPYGYSKGADGTSQFHTKMFAVTGPGTAFGDGAKHSPQGLSEIPDDTILVLEIAESRVHWMAPGDFQVQSIPQTVCTSTAGLILSRHSGGFHVLFADGNVWFLSKDTPFRKLQEFFTIEGAKRQNREDILGEYAITKTNAA
jgi:prepilin-type processing-associated H-X9-DG protein